jgi:hypothetical protein
VNARPAWRLVALALLLPAVLASVALAAAPAPARAPDPPAAGARTSRKPVAAKTVAADSLGRRRAAAAGGSGARGPASGGYPPRTLDDIHIEGEIPVPQVLFITARDQRRFMEFQHHRYTRTSLELGRGTAMPSRIVIPEPSPVVGKENPR